MRKLIQFPYVLCATAELFEEAYSRKTKKFPLKTTTPSPRRDIYRYCKFNKGYQNTRCKFARENVVPSSIPWSPPSRGNHGGSCWDHTCALYHAGCQSTWTARLSDTKHDIVTKWTGKKCNYLHSRVPLPEITFPSVLGFFREFQSFSWAIGIGTGKATLGMFCTSWSEPKKQWYIKLQPIFLNFESGQSGPEKWCSSDSWQNM